MKALIWNTFGVLERLLWMEEAMCSCWSRWLGGSNAKSTGGPS